MKEVKKEISAGKAVAWAVGLVMLGALLGVTGMAIQWARYYDIGEPAAAIVLEFRTADDALEFYGMMAKAEVLDGELIYSRAVLVADGREVKAVPVEKAIELMRREGKGRRPRDLEPPASGPFKGDRP